MTNWKAYKLISRDVNSSYIRFHLDDYVEYSGGSKYKYIDCKKYSPFTGWSSGYIEIDNDRTRYESSTHDFTSASEIRGTSTSNIFTEKLLS